VRSWTLAEFLDVRLEISRGRPVRASSSAATRLHASSLARKLQLLARVSCYARCRLRGRPHLPPNRDVSVAAPAVWRGGAAEGGSPPTDRRRDLECL